MTLLSAEDLFRFYHVGDSEIRALKGVSLEVGTGEIVALTGPSGSGKSTLIACLCGLDEPDGGTVEIDGRRMTRRPEAEKATIRASALGVMAQRDNLFGHLTVAENVAFSRDRRSDEGGTRTETILAAVALTERARAYPATLSGGEIARAGLAVALARDAPLIILDEPTAEVDAATERMILDLLVDRSGRGRSALIATHSSAVEAIATRSLHLSDGRLVERTNSKWTDPDHVALAEPFERPTDRHLASDRPTLIEARNLSRTFDLAGQSVHAVEGADLTLLRGDRVSVTGPSGSGKSTLLKMLAGIELPSTGELRWFGTRSAEDLRPRRIGVVFQEPSLIASLTVLENVALPLQLASSPTTRGQMTADEALDLLSLSDLAQKMPDEISGGQMQRVAFARALVTNPEIILADEPTGQLDQPTGHAVMHAVLDAFDRHGTTLLLTTHDARLAATMATQFHMDHGRLTTAA